MAYLRWVKHIKMFKLFKDLNLRPVKALIKVLL